MKKAGNKYKLSRGLAIERKEKKRKEKKKREGESDVYTERRERKGVVSGSRQDAEDCVTRRRSASFSSEGEQRRRKVASTDAIFFNLCLLEAAGSVRRPEPSFYSRLPSSLSRSLGDHSAPWSCIVQINCYR